MVINLSLSLLTLYIYKGYCCESNNCLKGTVVNQTKAYKGTVVNRQTKV